MHEKVARRIRTLEARAAEHEARDRAAAPPDYKSWGDPEARSLIAAAILRELSRMGSDPARPPGDRPRRLTQDDREALCRAAREMDALIVSEGIEAARRAYDALGGNDLDG